MKPIYVDQAGSISGGAGRLRHELLLYLTKSGRSDVEVIGLHTRLTPQWLAKRELEARGARRKIALNNASFMVPGGHKTVLLQNVIHFSTEAERRSIGYHASRRIKAQIPIIQAGAKVADRIIVPTDAMGERVVAVNPSLAPKIEVRMLPLSAPSWSGSQPQDDPIILLPQVPQPYKPLDWHVAHLAEALERGRLQARIVCTCDPAELPRSNAHPMVECIGTLAHGELESWYQRAQAIYFPTTFESFGYPIAQARAGGRWGIAQDTKQNQQIAAQSLAGYDATDLDSLIAAANQALQGTPAPQPEPFSPAEFFSGII